MSFDEVDQQAVNAIRALSMAEITHAKSGHPGLPLDAAPMAYVTFKRHLNIDPAHPDWFNRDRFVLSAGHGSSMLYALLHLSGYDLSIDDLKAFRQLGSRTPGHPELGTPGVDVATGPLGQGLGMAVGMAMAEKHLAAKYNQKDAQLIANRVYVIASDGDLMEGLSHESASLAGHLQLNNLIVMYDSNDVTLDANADKALNDNAGERFEAYGWNYLRVSDGNDLDALDRALSAAEDEQTRPTLIEVKTQLGYGSPHAGSHTVHGNPLTPEECKETMSGLGWNEPAFTVPEAVYNRYREIQTAGHKHYTEWQAQLHDYQQQYPDLAKSLLSNIQGTAKISASKAKYQVGDSEATRTTVHKLIQESAHQALNFWGGSADLSSSNKTYFENDAGFEPGHYDRQNVFYGVREFAQAAAVNGISLYGGSRTFGSTFFVFADYMRNAMRMAALMQTPSIFAFSHDSIALGQDGPTHQPIEQLDSIRAVPGLTLFRPADAVETQAVWQYALNDATGPVVIAMSRQNLPVLPGTIANAADGVTKGGYVVSDSGSTPSGILMATGSEVSLAVQVQSALHDQGIDVRVVSMPSTDLFAKQSVDYQESVLPNAIRNRMSIELGATLSWGRYTGLDGVNIGLDHFGASGDAGQLMKDYGFTVEAITEKYLAAFAK